MCILGESERERERDGVAHLRMLARLFGLYIIIHFTRGAVVLVFYPVLKCARLEQARSMQASSKILK